MGCKDIEKRREYGREYNKQWRLRNPEKVALQNQWKKTEEYRAKTRDRARQWRLDNPGRAKEASFKYYWNHVEELKLHKRALGQLLKTEILTTYGNGKLVCVVCGESRLVCLSLDHINGGGYKDKKTFGSSVNFWGWLKKKGYPLGYQTLCMNCKFVKRADTCYEGLGL